MAEDGAERAAAAVARRAVQVDRKVAGGSRAVEAPPLVAHGGQVPRKTLAEGGRRADGVHALDARYGAGLAPGDGELLDHARALRRRPSQEVAGVLARGADKDPLNAGRRGREQAAPLRSLLVVVGAEAMVQAPAVAAWKAAPLRRWSSGNAACCCGEGRLAVGLTRSTPAGLGLIDERAAHAVPVARRQQSVRLLIFCFGERRRNRPVDMLLLLARVARPL